MSCVLLVMQPLGLSCVAHLSNTAKRSPPTEKRPCLISYGSWPICFQYRWPMNQSVNSYSALCFFFFFLFWSMKRDKDKISILFMRKLRKRSLKIIIVFDWGKWLNNSKGCSISSLPWVDSRTLVGCLGRCMLSFFLEYSGLIVQT